MAPGTLPTRVEKGCRMCTWYKRKASPLVFFAENAIGKKNESIGTETLQYIT